MISQTIRPSPRRLHWLDALRGIAAVSVVLGHYFWGMLEFPGHTFFDPGLFGVAVFFFISGYIIPLSVRSERHAALRFAEARFFRLYPLYWVSLAFGVLVYSPSLVQIVANATMIQRFVGVGDVINVYWTLQIELLFYLIVMLTVSIGIFNRAWVVIGLALAFGLASALFGYARFHYQIRAPLSVPIGLACIFVGNLMSLAHTGHLSKRWLFATCACVAALLIASFYLGYVQDWGHDERPERFVVSYAIAIALFVGVSLFAERPLRIAAFFGMISYPMYLVHQPLLETMHEVLPSVDAGVVRMLTLPIVLACAYGLHYLVERPSARLGRAVARHRAFQPRAAVSPQGPA